MNVLPPNNKEPIKKINSGLPSVSQELDRVIETLKKEELEKDLVLLEIIKIVKDKVDEQEAILAYYQKRLDKAEKIYYKYVEYSASKFSAQVIKNKLFAKENTCTVIRKKYIETIKRINAYRNDILNSIGILSADDMRIRKTKLIKRYLNNTVRLSHLTECLEEGTLLTSENLSKDLALKIKARKNITYQIEEIKMDKELATDIDHIVYVLLRNSAGEKHKVKAQNLKMKDNNFGNWKNIVHHTKKSK